MSEDSGEFAYIHEASKCNSFFGEVKFRTTASADYEVGVVVMPDPKFGFELSLAALAIDGSKSMMVPFAAHLPTIAQKKRNKVSPMAQDIADHLAKNAKDQVALAYWACGNDGGDIEPIGMLSSEEISSFYFSGPENWGGGTKLTPIVEYFWEQVFGAGDADKDGVAAIITDGAWDDDDQQSLTRLSESMSAQIASGGRRLMKCVLLPMITETNQNEIAQIEARINELDDLDIEVDIWDHKWLDHMWDYNQIFIELVKEMPLGIGGRILDSSGNQIVARDEFNFGIEFVMPGNSSEFTLVLEDIGEFKQAVG